MKNNIFAFVSAIFDTLGISGFATMTYWMKRTEMVSDYRIPSTLNAHFCIPTILQAILFVSAISVDLTTLGVLTLSGIIGSYLGVKYYKTINENSVRKILSRGLFLVALLVLAGVFGIIPSGGMAMGLSGYKLIIAFIGVFVANFLEAIGIGSYAPSIALLYLLGMNPVAAFPIMMLSSAIDMPMIVYFYNKDKLIDWHVVWKMIPFTVAGVLVAFFIFSNISIVGLKMLVVAILFHAAYLFSKDIKEEE